MANQKQLNLLKRKVRIWNRWREQNRQAFVNLSGADLSGAELSQADLSGADLNKADLSGASLNNADLKRADLSEANLIGTNLSSANLTRAYLHNVHLNEAYLNNAKLNGANLSRGDLSGADLSGAELDGADLSEANLSGADLNGADLNGADLSRADLSGADLSNTKLDGTNLSNAIAGWSLFVNLDLRNIIGLETINHQGPSEIGVSTLENSNGDIPYFFLRGVGLSEESISYTRTFLQHPIEYYSCFLSYSKNDQRFAERLYADLQQKGIRCWFAPHNLQIGDHFPNRIEEAIRTYEKLLLILSESSVQSEWVEDEVRAALEKEERFRKEQHQERTVLFPIRIDPAIEHASMQWAAKLRRTRHIGNFTNWKDHDTYLESFQLLTRDLKVKPRIPEE